MTSPALFEGFPAFKYQQLIRLLLCCVNSFKRRRSPHCVPAGNAARQLYQIIITHSSTTKFNSLISMVMATVHIATFSNIVSSSVIVTLAEPGHCPVVTLSQCGQLTGIWRLLTVIRLSWGDLMSDADPMGRVMEDGFMLRMQTGEMMEERRSLTLRDTFFSGGGLIS